MGPRGRAFAQIVNSVNDERRVTCVEQWADGDQRRGRFGTERFTRLMALPEAAAERPVVEFRVISETHGLECVAIAMNATGAVR